MTTPPPIPDDEAGRLRALHACGILDSPAEAGFDDLTRLAAEICRTPIALVSLVDASRQWFKSRLGLDAAETPRAISFCAHAVAARALLVVSDALDDERFAENPLVVASPGIRFYAGAPLETADGYVLGTLCVIDTEPRVLSGTQRDALLALARQVVALLELRKTVYELRLSESRARLLLASANDVVYTHTLDGRLTSVNPAATRMFGYTEEELLGLSIGDIIAPEFLSAVEGAIARGLGTEGSSEPFEFLGRRRDGSTVWLEVRAALLDDGQRPVEVQGVVRDISKRKRVEESLARLATIVQFSDDAIISKKLGGEILTWNRGAERVYGYTAAEAVGMNIDRLFPEDRLDELASIRARLARGEAVESLETVRVRRDGSRVDLSVSISPIFDATGRVTSATTIARDIPRQKRVEEELRAARTAAELATRSKSEFVANMSHEIRTPMNAVIGMTELLLATELGDEQRNYAETIRASGESLLVVINDILDFSKIESGKLEIEAEPFGLRDCVEGALDVLAPRAAEQKLTLAYSIEPGTPPGLVTDPTRLRQVLVNLVSNAVKFTAAGQVIVAVSAAPAADGAREFRFDVSDSGIGIAHDRRDGLFAPFSQLDASSTRRYGGTGLGLAISKQLVELMGGTIGVESERGRGSTFSFTVMAPALAESPNAPPPERLATIAGRHALVADGEPVNRTLLAELLAGWGMEATVVSSPAEALAAARGGTRFDVAIVDSRLDAREGVPLAEALASIEATRETPVVLLAPLGAPSWPSARQVAPTGPIKSRLLLDAIARALGGPGRATGSLLGGALAPTGAKALRILVAEDHPVNQRVALLTLKQLGYTADVVDNGVEAVRACEREPYDVVLMDVHMPEMDGLEATRTIRERLSGSRGPRIIAMTANAMQGDRELCLSAGMDDYLSKPVRAAVLREALERSSAAREPAPASNDGALDLARIAELRELGGDDGDALLLELAELFIAGAGGHIAAIAAGLAKGDSAAVAAAAHALKGGAANIGLPRLASASSTIESSAKDGAIEIVAAMLPALERELDAGTSALRALTGPQ